MSKNKKEFYLSIPDETMSLLFSNNAVSRISQPLTLLLDQLPIDRDAVINALSLQDDGSIPILLGGQIWLTSILNAGSEKIVLLKNPSRLELEEWLEFIQGGRASILTDASGRIYTTRGSLTEK